MSSRALGAIPRACALTTLGALCHLLPTLPLPALAVALLTPGLTADGRILIDKARVECQSHRLTVEDPVTVEYITKHIAGIQQRYTQSGGVRPFGISTLIVGFDPNDTKPFLFMTEPSGIYSAWKVSPVRKEGSADA